MTIGVILDDEKYFRNLRAIEDNTHILVGRISRRERFMSRLERRAIFQALERLRAQLKLTEDDSHEVPTGRGGRYY